MLFDTAAAAQLSSTAGEAEPLIYESPHLTATGIEIAAQTGAVGGYTLDATFCAIVKSPEQCWYYGFLLR